MRRLLLAFALVGCGGAEPVNEPVMSFRDQSVPIASQVDVSFDQINARFFLFRAATFDSALPVNAKFRSWGGDLSLVIDTQGMCFSPTICEPYGSYFRLEPLGPGRWSLVTSRDDLDLLQGRDTGTLWILWADADRRTLAIGTPDGSFGFILDRNETGGEDRIAAALDIMAWMGYRTEEMVNR